MEIGKHRRLGHARIGDDQRFPWIGFEPLPENRMVVGDVGANQQDDVGALEILVRPRRPIAAERPFVAGHGRRHAQRRVAIVVLRPQAQLRQLAERVELLGDELTSTNDADGVVAVTPLHVPKSLRHRLDGVGPANSVELRLPRWPEHRMARASRGVNRLVLGQAFWTEHAGVDGMIRIAANAHRPSVFDADEHAAADRAVPAGRRDPVIRHPLR